MPLLRLLSTSLLTSAFILQASAQFPAVSPTQTLSLPAVTITNPQTFTTKSLPSAFSVTLPQTAQPDSSLFDISKDSVALALHADADTQPLGGQAKAKAKALALLNLKQREPLLAQTHQPCYTMRTYGFTAQDLKSSHPHSSSETDCTLASSAKLKAIQIQGVQVPATMSVEIPATK